MCRSGDVGSWLLGAAVGVARVVGVPVSVGWWAGCAVMVASVVGLVSGGSGVAKAGHVGVRPVDSTFGVGLACLGGGFSEFEKACGWQWREVWSPCFPAGSLVFEVGDQFGSVAESSLACVAFCVVDVVVRVSGWFVHAVHVDLHALDAGAGESAVVADVGSGDCGWCGGKEALAWAELFELSFPVVVGSVLLL